MKAIHRLILPASIVGLCLASPNIAFGQPASFDLGASLARVGAQLQHRYQRAQRIVATEMVWVRSFNSSMQPNGAPRRLEFERRVEWGATGEYGIPTVTVFRELKSVNGREPHQRDLDACLTPRSETEDPLSVLLPVRQMEFMFSLTKLEWVDGRQVARVDYVPLQEGLAEVTWDEDCVSISLPGRSRGEVWIDVESGDVLRLNERLMAPFDFREPEGRTRGRRGWVTLEGVDVSIRYRRVRFEDPSETLMLPHSIERSWRLRGGGFVPRYYRNQQFSEHRRFVTGGRLVEASSGNSEPRVR